MNQLKATLKTGMGSCGAKTCGPLIKAIFRQENIPQEEVTPFTERPLIGYKGVLTLVEETLMALRGSG